MARGNRRWIAGQCTTALLDHTITLIASRSTVITKRASAGRDADFIFWERWQRQYSPAEIVGVPGTPLPGASPCREVLPLAVRTG